MTVATDFAPVTSDQRWEIVRQIGRMNMLAVSGGRFSPLEDGVELPVSYGYKVRIRLTWLDEYVVERVLVRGGKEFSKGSKDADCFTVGNLAYYASCFRNDSETNGEWNYLG